MKRRITEEGRLGREGERERNTERETEGMNGGKRKYLGDSLGQEKHLKCWRCFLKTAANLSFSDVKNGFLWTNIQFRDSFFFHPFFLSLSSYCCFLCICSLLFLFFLVSSAISFIVCVYTYPFARRRSCGQRAEKST